MEEKIRRTLRYFHIVLRRAWQTTLQETKIAKLLFGIAGVGLILSCLVILVLAEVLPEGFSQLIDDFGSEFRIGLVRFTLAFLLISLMLPIAFVYEAANIYYDQQEIINERKPDSLAIDVERGPDVLLLGGIEKRIAALFVTSHEKKKIISLQAYANYKHHYYSSSRGFPQETEYEINLLLLWWNSDNHKFVEKIDLLPEIAQELYIGEIQKFNADGGQTIFLSVFGDSHIGANDTFGEESIFRINIMFQGKLEGEDNIRITHFETFVYAKPVDQRMLLLDNLDDISKTYPDIPKKLIDKVKHSAYRKTTPTH